MLRSFTVIFNVICTNHKIKKLRSCSLGLSIIALLLLSSCMTLDYVSGIYEQSPDQQVDVLVRVKNQRGIAMTDLVLNDFYVRHNNQVLERKNDLRLNEDLSAVKLYLVILIDQRQNDQLKYDFERTRQAVKAYLTLQSSNTYIKIISYDREAHALNAEFSNDKNMLRGLISQLNTVQMETPETALSGALAMAEESIEALPYGSYILDPQKFTAEQVRNAEGPLLYNSAILLMNHNQITVQDLAPYSNDYNFIVLDSTRSMSNGLQVNTLPSEERQYAAESNAARYTEPQAELVASNTQSSQTNVKYQKMPSIFETYELPPTDLNINTNQSVAVDFVDQVWESLANIVNGYYWLSYNKYTDLHIGEPRRVAVSLTQYGRSRDSGELGDYANLSLAENSVPDSTEDTSAFEAVVTIDPAVDVEKTGLLPSAIIEKEDFMSNLDSNHYDADLLSLLPGRYFASYEDAAARRPVIAAVEEQDEASNVDETDETDLVDDFEILTELDSDNDELLVSSDDTPAPQYTARPIPLVGKESVPVADAPVVEHPMASPSASLSRSPSEFPSEPMFEDDPALKPFFNGHYIQVGAFTKLENLYNTIESLSGKYDVRAVSSVINGREYNRCIIGPFKDKAETEKVHNELKTSSRLSDAFIIRKPIEEWIGK